MSHLASGSDFLASWTIAKLPLFLAQHPVSCICGPTAYTGESSRTASSTAGARLAAGQLKCLNRRPKAALDSLFFQLKLISPSNTGLRQLLQIRNHAPLRDQFAARERAQENCAAKLPRKRLALRVG